jgi:hypothetical protein
MKDEATRPGGPKNVGDQPTRDGLAPPAPSTPSLASSDTEDPATSPAPTGESGNGNAVPVNPNGIRKPSFQEIEDADQERVFGKRDDDGVLVGGDPSYAARDKDLQDLIRKNKDGIKIEKFGKDLMGLGSSGKLGGINTDDIFKYGDSLGITQDQIKAQIKKGSDAPREKDKRLEIDPKYAVTDEQAAAMDKTGINGKTQEAIELEKIKKEFNAGKSPEQQKASEARDADVLARNNQDRIGLDALKTPDDFPGKGEDLSADQIRARGKERMTEYDRLEKERLSKRGSAIAPLSENSKEASTQNNKDSESSQTRDREKTEESEDDRGFFSSLASDVNKALSPIASSVDDVMTGFGIGLLNRSENTDKAKMSSYINQISRLNEDISLSVESGKTRTSESGRTLDRLDISNKEKTKQEMYGRIINLQKKTGLPIWEDKELMANPAFREKAMADPVLKEKIQAYKNQTKERNAQQSSFNNSQRMQKEFQGHSDLMTKLLT